MNTKLDKKITQQRLKLHFFFFLKKIKGSITQKLLFINIYFFIRNYSFIRFKSIVKHQIKTNQLKFKLKQLRVRRFINKTKEIITSIKNPNGRITSVHAYLFYFHSLKQRTIQGLRLSIKQSKITNRTKVLLYSIRAKIATACLFLQLQKIYQLKNLPNKERNFNLLVILRALKAYTQRELAGDEKFRLIRRFVYINTVKYALKHITTIGLKAIKQENQLESLSKVYGRKKGLALLRMNTSVIAKLKRKKVTNYCLAKKHFIKRMKYHIMNKHLLLKNIQILLKKIVLIENRKTIAVMQVMYQMTLYKEESIKTRYQRKNALRALKQFALKNSQFHLKVSQMRRKMNSNKLLFFTELKAQAKERSVAMKKNAIGMKHIMNKARVSFIKTLKKRVALNREERDKSLHSINHYIFGLKHRIYSKLMLNQTIQEAKKKEYNEIAQMRSEIISRKLFQNLLVTYSKQINQKEDYISNQLMTKRAKGLRVAFLWYKKLKALVVLRKKYKRPSQTSNVKHIHIKPNRDEKIISNQAKTIKEAISVNKANPRQMIQMKNEKELAQERLYDDLNELKQLRNKKRVAPKKLESMD